MTDIFTVYICTVSRPSFQFLCVDCSKPEANLSGLRSQTSIARIDPWAHASAYKPAHTHTQGTKLTQSQPSA